MRPCRASAWIGALLLLAAGAPAQAAWNNVFQVCCHSCRSQSSYAPVAAPAPCPQPCQPACTTQYQLRSFYQPVTTYRASYYLEPVTTYRTSYYYEPVTSYRYSCYYDPCTCRYQQVATPVTGYQLRSQCSPVTSYLQRCQMVPVTTQQLAYYYEPVTTCCSTTVGAPIFPGQPPAQTPSLGTPSSPNTPSLGAPSNGEGRDRLPPGGDTSRKIGIPEPGSRFTPLVPQDNASRQPDLRQPVPAQPTAPPQPPPSARLDRIVLLPESSVEGKVLAENEKPQSGAKVVFVSADQLGAKETVTADAQGQFRLSLASGGWLVYVHDARGNPVFKEKIEVKDNEPRRVLLTSR